MPVAALPHMCAVGPSCSAATALSAFFPDHFRALEVSPFLGRSQCLQVGLGGILYRIFGDDFIDETHHTGSSFDAVCASVDLCLFVAAVIWLIIRAHVCTAGFDPTMPNACARVILSWC